MKKFLCVLMVLGVHCSAQAEIYKHVDADGHVTYSNVPMKGAVKLNLEPSVPSSAPAAKSKTTTPANFPRVEKSEQKQRDEKRRQILEAELAGERQALEAAKAAYAEAEQKPEVFSNVLGEDGKPLLGGKEGAPVIGSDGKPVIGTDGKPVTQLIGSDGKPVIGKDGKAVPFRKKGGRNMAKYAEKLNQLSEEIKNHENNIEMLELELSRL